MTPSDKPFLDPTGLTGVSRRAFFRYSGTLGAAAALTAALSACGGPSSTNQVNNGQPAGGGGIAAGSPGSSGSGGTGGPQGTIEATVAFTLSSGFDPMNASSAVATAANQHIFEALIDLDPITRKPYLALAKEQPTASADGLTWTVSLRDGAKFSDGTDVTADDVAWSFTRAADPDNKALMAGFIPFIDKVTAKDKTTAEFTLKYPFSLFAQRIAVIKIVPKAKTPKGDKAFDTAPIGSGPFKLDSSAANLLKFSANPAYNATRPALVTAMTWNATPDAAARVSDLTGGRAQAIEAIPYLNVAGVKAASKFTVDEVQAFNLLFLMFNCSAKPFDDKRVRQALHYALDKDKIVKTALQGFGTPATSYLDEGNAGYQKADTVYAYDPEKAKSLLAEAGVKDLSFQLVTTDTAFIKDAAPLIIEQWKAIGVNASQSTNPSSAVYGNIVPADGFRVLAASGDPTVFGPDVDLLLRWFYYGKTWPVDRYRWDPATAKKAADLIDAAAKAKDETEQKTTWKQVLDLVADDAPLYPVFHVKTITGSDPAKLKDFKGAATTGLYFLDVSRQG